MPEVNRCESCLLAGAEEIGESQDNFGAASEIAVRVGTLRTWRMVGSTRCTLWTGRVAKGLVGASRSRIANVEMEGWRQDLSTGADRRAPSMGNSTSGGNQGLGEGISRISSDLCG